MFHGVMKANAPEKIYIINHMDYSDRRILNAFTEKENNNDIEYTRTDSFIENAFEFFDLHLWEYINVKANCNTFINIDGNKLKEDFKNYMKER